MSTRPIGVGDDDCLLYEQRQAEASIPRVFYGIHALREAAKSHRVRVRLAAASHVPQTVKKYGATKLNEASLAKLLRGSTSNNQNEPFDVYAGKHAIEVKTIEESGHDRITMHPKSLKTKLLAAKKGGYTPHTVVFDTRKGKEAVYYREGLGSFRLAQMRKLPGVEAIREALGLEDVQEVIHKTGSGYQVRSEKGKNLSKPGMSKGQAKKRLAQVEYFKHKEAEEHGVKGMKWGVRKGQTQKAKTFPPEPVRVEAPKPVPPQSVQPKQPSLAQDPRTLGMMQIEKWESRAREHGGDGTIMHPLDSDTYIPMHESRRLLQEGGPGSGFHGHSGRPGEVGGAGPGGGEQKPRAPRRPLGEKYGLAGQVGHGYKAKIARRLFGKPYQGLEKHEKEQVRTELRNRGIVRPKGTTDASAEEKELLIAKITSVEKMHSGGVNSSYKVTFEGGAQAVFKPEDEVYKQVLRNNVSRGYDVEREVGAWKVAKLVGMQDIASPTVERVIEGQRGSLQRFWDGKMAADLGDGERFDGSKDLHRAAAFDYVIGNEDRNIGNWLVGHGRLQLIDHGLCFPEKEYGGGGTTRHHLILEKVFSLESPDMTPKEAAEPFVSKKSEILSALREAGLKQTSMDGVSERIDNLAREKDWKDLPRAKYYRFYKGA